jgi:hypothetical protein
VRPMPRTAPSRSSPSLKPAASSWAISTSLK